MTNPEHRSATGAIRVATFAARVVAAGAALYSFASYWTFAGSRLFEPYALTWIEPIFVRGALESAARRPIYAAPSLDYTAAIYNPGIAWVGGWLFGWSEPGIVALRVFSFAAFAALVGVLAWFAQRRSHDWGWTCAIAASALAMSPSVGYMTSTIHADSASVLLSLAGILLVYRDTGARWLAAAVCVVLGFAFKQQGAAFGLAIAIALAPGDPRRAFRFALVCGGLGALFEAGLYAASEGWAWVYTFRIPLETASRPVGNFVGDLFSAHPTATVALTVGAGALALAERPRWRWFWPLLCAAALAMSRAGYGKVGGAANSLLPAFAVGIAALAALHAAIGERVANAPRRSALQLALLLVVTVSAFVELAPVRRRAIALQSARAEAEAAGIVAPTYPRRAAFERRLREAVMRSEGRVFVGARFAAWADLGRPLNTHQIGLFEGTDHAPVFDLDDLDRQFARQEYAKMWIWEHPFDPNFERLLNAHYREVRPFGVDPLAGHRVSIWEPIERRPTGPADSTGR